MTKPKAKTPPRLNPKRAEALRKSVTTSSTVDLTAILRAVIRDELSGRDRVPIVMTPGGEAAAQRIDERERINVGSLAGAGEEHTRRVDPPGKKTGRLIEIARGLDMLCERLARVQDQLVTFNDDRLGAAPQPPSNPNSAPEPLGHSGEVARLVGRAHRIVEAIEAEVSRAHDL